MHNILPGNSLIIIYKSFIRPHLGYGTIIFDQPEKFCKKIKSVQYNAALAITGAIQVTSREKLYKELGLQILKSKDNWKNCVASITLKIMEFHLI